MAVVVAGVLAAAPAPAQPPPLPRLSVLPFAARGLDRDRAAALETVLAFELGRVGRYEVVSTADVDAMFGAERRKDLAGCDDVTCATDIARALAARFVVSPSIARLDDRVVVSLALIDLEDRRVVGRAQIECADEAELWPTAVAQAVRKLAPPAPDPELPADGEQRWLARLDALLRPDEPCERHEACLAAARSRVAEIDRVLAEAAWPPEYEERRSALERRRAELLRGIDALEVAILRRGSPASPRAGAPGASSGAATGRAADDAVARMIVELQELRRRRAGTLWTWENRDDRARLDRRIAELEAGVEAARKSAELAAAGAARAGRPMAAPPASAQEVAIEVELKDLRRELATTRWGWQDRDRKAAVEARIASLRETLELIRQARGAAAK